MVIIFIFLGLFGFLENEKAGNLSVIKKTHFNLVNFFFVFPSQDLTTVRLLSEKTKELGDVAYANAVEGRIVALAALLAVAAEKVNEAVLELRDADSGSKEKVTIYECVIREALSLAPSTTPLRAAKRTSTTTESDDAEKRRILLLEIELLQLFGAVAFSSGTDKKVMSPLIRAAQVSPTVLQFVLFVDLLYKRNVLKSSNSERQTTIFLLVHFYC